MTPAFGSARPTELDVRDFPISTPAPPCLFFNRPDDLDGKYTCKHGKRLTWAQAREHLGLESEPEPTLYRRPALRHIQFDAVADLERSIREFFALDAYSVTGH